MRGLNNQIWVTSALTDQDVPNAMVLCYSLKRSFTNRGVAVIASSKTSPHLREALDYAFDFLFYLDEDRNTAALETKDFVKLSVLTLKAFEKCVYLSPNMLVLKNCDELFGEHKDFKGFISTNKMDFSICVLRPNLDVFKVLMGGLKQRNGIAVEQYLRDWSMNQNGSSMNIEEKYDWMISDKNGNASEISIVKIMGYEWTSVEQDNLEPIGKAAIKYWVEIDSEDVQPLIKQTANPSVPQILHEQGNPAYIKYNKEPIAIVGMSCRYPSANNLEEFWDLIFQGKDGTGNPPPFRWLKDQSARNRPDNKKTNAGFLKVPIDAFDAKFFGISPKEMVFMDPQHRLLHELIWEGLEDAAVNPTELRGTNGGVFMGSWTNDYKDILNHSGNQEMYRQYMGNSIGAAAARISFLLGMTGPSIATESGCSSAMVAVHLACRSLQLGETNFALACGVNLLLHPFDKDEMPMVLSPDGHCKTFDANANGFARAEGCGVLVLKRLSDAVKNGDHIWGLIRGSGVSQEGVSRSMGTPTVHCEALAMEEALQDSGVDPELVSYVEAHGTGTVVGDPMEVAAIAQAYHSKNRKEPLLIGSVKTNVGHTESCSGITGIMKVVLAMRHEAIPAHINFETLNPSINLEAVPAEIPLQTMKWPKVEGKPRYAGVSSFGITGTDAHLIIEEPPTISVRNICTVERPQHILKISAKTEEALEILLESYQNHINASTNKFSDMAYSANVGRASFNYRAVVIAKSKEDAVKQLQQKKFVRGEGSSESIGKVCFLFTGQGSQYPGMANQLYEKSPVFRLHFDYCEKILQDEYNISIKKVLWSNENKEISRTIYSQTSIFCVEYALLKLWESWGLKPDYALGHSLGEFAAAVCAGILTAEDAIKLVAERSRLIDELPRGKMLVIKADKPTVDREMKKFAESQQSNILDYAAINSNQQTVVAGDSDVIMQFAQRLTERNQKCIMLDATHAFHSKHMDPMLNDYRNITKTLKDSNTKKCQYISGMRGNLVNAGEINSEYWVQHTREKVDFLNASKAAVELGCQVFIEVGPQPVLSALTMMNNDGNILCLPSLKRNDDEWSTILNTVAKLYVNGLEIDWKSFDKYYNRKKVRLPHYPFIGKKFWPDMMAVTGASIHPLVGSVIPNASSTKLFQCGFNLRSLEYIKDHAIGSNVIFPGAGYLEMCLASGLATVEGCVDTLPAPTRPMKVENLLIEAPLCVYESKTCHVQTVVDCNSAGENVRDWNDMTVTIFHRLESDASESVKWLSHAKATFSPLLMPEDTAIHFDKTGFQTTIAKPYDEKQVDEVYEKLASIGLKFGPTFKSLEKVWRDDENSILVAKVKTPNGDETHSQYIVHPAVLDAMIQAIMMLYHTTNLKKKLYVPIKIGKFVWLSSTEDSEIYIHAFNNSPSLSTSTSSTTALLVDSKGRLLAFMSNVEFIDTTVKAVEAVLEQQTTSMPDLWEEVWRQKLGPLQYPLDLERCKDEVYPLDFVEAAEEKNKNPGHNLMETLRELEELVYLNMLQCLYDSGWKPQLNEVFNENEFFANLKFKVEFRKYFGFILDVLGTEGILKSNGTGEWTVVRMPPSFDKICNDVSSSRLCSDLIKKFNATLLLKKVGENLCQMLRGSQSTLSILFPGEKMDWPSVGDFYKDVGKVFKAYEHAIKIATESMRQHWVPMKGEKFVMRILEVGAGTGLFATGFLEVMEKFQVEFEYTYTDISAAFFPAAEKKFEKYAKNMHFKKLNIEEDAISQGFIPEYYDVICAFDVIHATKDIRATLSNLRMLLKPYGAFEMFEMTRVNRFITYLFGLLDGFWRFEDTDLRQKHCTLSKHLWKEAFEYCGFDVKGIFPCLNDYHSYISVQHNGKDNRSFIKTTKADSPAIILFHQNNTEISEYLKIKIPSVNRQVILVRPGTGFLQLADEYSVKFEVRLDNEEDFKMLVESIANRKIIVEGIVYCWALDSSVTSQAKLLQPYFYITKHIPNLKQSKSPRVIAITRGVAPIEDNNLAHCHPSTLLGFTKSLKNENAEMLCRCVDVTDETLDESRLLEIFYEIWNCDKEIQIAYHKGARYTPKMQPFKHYNNDLKLPSGTNRFQLILPETKAIQDLQFGPLDQVSLAGSEIEIQVKASALNFRDVFSVLKPIEKFKDINAVGFDFAGVVKSVGSEVTKWKKGDLVFGVNVNGAALPSHVKLHEDDVLPVPNNMTLCEAATLPAVFATAYYCLIDTAKITSSDTVLIHTASGGVGLSAIEICKHVGAKIFATAGSKRKQNYLRSLGIQHIFHSRNTNFGDEILKVTNGRGVDVVLNSLTSEGFKEASLKACAKGARFVEMSKLSIWEPDEVKHLRPDVDYTIVDVSSVDENEWRRLMNSLKNLANKKVINPIPYVRFDGVNIREALQYLQKAKHIGKVVCVMPEVRNEGGEMKVFTPMFSDRSTYLITGGFGGIGFVVCKWMVEKGAKNILLAGRSPPSSVIKREIDEMNSKGSNVIPVKLDVSDYEQCRSLIEEIIPNLGLPDLRGVMHAAGTLSDGLIVNQSWNTLSSTFETKVDGTLNLHELTKKRKLEHFVMYSSIAAMMGPPGQCNHAAGNLFEDTIAHYRHSIGLPGTTINWGQWGQVGIATEIDLPGIRTLSNLQGVNALEYTLKTQRTQICACNIESFVLMSKLFPHLAVYLDERVWKAASSSASITIKSDEFWQEYDSQLKIEKKVEVLKGKLRNILKSILKMEENDIINDEDNFQEIGVDSLMFVEIKNHLQALLGDRVTVNATALRDCNNLKLLSETLIKLIEGGDVDEENIKPTMEQVSELMREDCQLPESIMAKPKQEAISVKDVATVLLTGCTGTLGPYVLRELTRLSQIKQVYCLVRPRKKENAEERLVNTLSSRELLPEINMNKVKCISGDVASPHLGMEPHVWDELARIVDAVFHCAASVQHLEHYRKTINSEKDMRAVNIGGIKNVLEFCCENKLKCLYNASSLLGVATTDQDGRVSEDWPAVGDYDGITTISYPITKFVGDVLTKEAVDRGIPCKSFRFPFMGGDSRTGRFILEQNHFMLRFMFMMKNGVMPSNPFPMIMLPVDICAQVSLQLFFNDEKTSEIYNVTHHQPDTDQEFLRVASKLGHEVKTVEFSEFAKLVLDSTTDDSPLVIFKEFYRNDEDLMALYTTAPLMRNWLEGVEDFWKSDKLTAVVPNFYDTLNPSTMEYIYKDLLFAKSQGWFRKVGL